MTGVPSGATPFTRTAGKVGVVSTAVAVAYVVLGTISRPRGHDPGDLVLPVVFFACGVVSVVGLLARHRRHAWVSPVAVVLLAAIVLAPMGDRRPAVLVGTVGAVALWTGVLVAGDLPRRGAALCLVGLLGELATRNDVFGLLGFVGWLLVCWAMWHEPIGDEEPDEYDTPLAAAAQRV